MKMNVNYFDNDILLINDKIFVIEIENKIYFYRFVNDLHMIYDYGLSDNILFFDEEGNELSCPGKILLILNYFDFSSIFKRYINEATKYVVNNIDGERKNYIVKKFFNILKSYNDILGDIDLPLSINEPNGFDEIIKLFKLKIEVKNNLLENILLLIDIEKELKLNKLLIFINLKQLLTDEELKEVYKYAIYNQVVILLVDSQCYGTSKEYEKKLIIDSNLDEFLL